MLLYSIIILFSTFINSVAGNDFICSEEGAEGLCRSNHDCLETGFDREYCRDSGRICCPPPPTSYMDRRMTVIKKALNIRRPIVKMRNPLRSMIRRRKRRPSTHKSTSMMANRLAKPNKQLNKHKNPLSSKLPQNHPYGKYSDKPLSYFYNKQTNSKGVLQQSQEASTFSDLRPEDYISRHKLNELQIKSNKNQYYGATGSLGLYGDAPIALGAGKPSSSDVAMFPEEPDIFKNSDLFDAMFRPRKPSHTSRRMAELKCDEYKKISTETIAELSKFGMVPKKIEKCSLAGMEAAGPSGIARTAEFPHVAGLGYDDDGETVWACGGALISEQYILTAAHCMYTPLGRPVKVEVGETRLGETTSHVLRISDVSVHPLYNATGRYNDIALLRLAKRLRFRDSARPTCLQTGRYYDVAAVGTHWEPVETMSLEVRLKSNLSTHRFSDGSETVGLRKAPYTILDNSECGIPQDTSDSLLCVRTSTPGLTCSSEGGGGPLQVRQGANKCMYSVIGIASMKSCEEPTLAIYTRIAHFLPWIESIVWA